MTTMKGARVEFTHNREEMSEEMEEEMIVEIQEEEMEITIEIVAENTQEDNSSIAPPKTLTGHLDDPKSAADLGRVAKATDLDLDFSQGPLEKTRVTLQSDSHDEGNMQEDEQRKAQHGTKRSSDKPDTSLQGKPNEDPKEKKKEGRRIIRINV